MLAAPLDQGHSAGHWEGACLHGDGSLAIRRILDGADGRCTIHSAYSVAGGNEDVGLIVNPIAGMGGSVGLKGTDGEMITERDAWCTTGPARAATFLAGDLTPKRHCMVGASRENGGGLPDCLSLPFTLIDGSPDPEGETSANDTRRAAIAMVQAGADLLVFVGGDGTYARHPRRHWG